MKGGGAKNIFSDWYVFDETAGALMGKKVIFFFIPPLFGRGCRKIKSPDSLSLCPNVCWPSSFPPSLYFGVEGGRGFFWQPPPPFAGRKKKALVLK